MRKGNSYGVEIDSVEKRLVNGKVRRTVRWFDGEARQANATHAALADVAPGSGRLHDIILDGRGTIVAMPLHKPEKG